MTLTAASTETEVQQVLLDNANFASTGSTSGAHAFIDACTHVINRNLVVFASRGGSAWRIDPAVAASERKRAEEFLARVRPGGSVTKADFRDFRR